MAAGQAGARLLWRLANQAQHEEKDPYHRHPGEEGEDKDEPTAVLGARAVDRGLGGSGEGEHHGERSQRSTGDPNGSSRRWWQNVEAGT